MRFLVVQTAFLGDVILTLPLLSAIKGRHPGSSVTLVVTPSGARMAGLFTVADQLAVFDKRGRDGGPGGLFKFGRKLRGNGFDAAICPHRSLRSGILTAISGAPVRCGFSTGPASFFMNHRLVRPGVEHSESAIEGLLGLLDGEGDPGSASIPPAAYFKPDLEVLETAEGRIGGGMRGGPLVTLVVGSNWGTKRWPSGRYALLARELVARGMHVAIEGGPDDIPIAKEVLSVAGDGVTDLTGNTLAEAAAVISISDLVIGGDTGLVHLARMLGRRVLAIFGPTEHSLHRFASGHQKALYASIPCRPCSMHGPDSCPEGHFNCMYAMTPDMVLYEALGLLGGS